MANKDYVIEQLRKQIENFKTETETQKVGKVIEVSDGVARVSGLSDVMASEMVEFPNGDDSGKLYWNQRGRRS
jgi:F-type H+-transporting ATPase subunit alpha